MNETLYDDVEAIIKRSERHLDKGDGYVPWGTGLVETARNWSGAAMSKLQEWSQDDPDSLHDDALRLLGGGLKNVANTTEDWMDRSEEGEIGLRSLAGTALRVMDWTSDKGADIGGDVIQRLGGHEDIGRFAGSLIGDAVGTAGIGLAGKGALRGTKAAAKLASRRTGIQALMDTVGGQGMAAHAGTGLHKGLNKIAVPKFGSDYRSQYLKLTNKKDKVQWLKDHSRWGELKASSMATSKGPYRRMYTPEFLASKKGEGLLEAIVERSDEILEQFAKGDKRRASDVGAKGLNWQHLTPPKDVYGTTVQGKVKEVWLHLTGRDWHHIFGNDVAAKTLLNDISNDPVIIANLFEHMDNLGVRAGAGAENMALMSKARHIGKDVSWHKWMMEEGMEPWVQMKADDTIEILKSKGLLAQQQYKRPDLPELAWDQRFSKSKGDPRIWKYTAPLDAGDIGASIAQAVQEGTTDINELFTFMRVYSERYLPWVKDKLKNDPRFKADFLADLPEGPEKALLLGLYDTSKTIGRRSKP